MSRIFFKGYFLLHWLDENFKPPFEKCVCVCVCVVGGSRYAFNLHRVLLYHGNGY